jgi:hypothetical protein
MEMASIRTRLCFCVLALAVPAGQAASPAQSSVAAHVMRVDASAAGAPAASTSFRGGTNIDPQGGVLSMNPVISP